jgi:cytochrome c-type biogenesis protein CcmF
MIFDVGHLILISALLITIFGVVVAFWGGHTRNVKLVASSFNAVYAGFALVFVAAVILWYGLLGDHFELSYVWNHSEIALPTFYKFAALWGGQSGSLLFWVLILTGFSTAVALQNRHKHQVLMPYVNGVLMSTSIFFLTLLVFAASPFERVAFVPADGQGLNPLLQNYWMVIHPVMLYLGYVGLAVPYAFATAALISRKLDNEWVRTVRRWTLIPWLFLSIGIIMGSQWAYMELGWGGYWAWDPVENASFLPWLTATAFLHSIIIQEQRGILKVWNMVLIWATYFLVILGTFTTRSGVLESVHSFARSDVGVYFLVFLIIVVFSFLYLLFSRLPLLKAEQPIDSYMSREAAFLANNWVFTAIAFATLWGTFFPMFSELLTGQRISVAAPFFNKVNGPLFMLLVILMGVGPLMGWRHTSAAALRKQFVWPIVTMLVVGVATFFIGGNLFAALGLAVLAFATATIVQEYVRGIMARRATTSENVIVAMGNLWRRNGRRYGGYLVHLSIVMIGIAIVGNEFYQQTTNVTLARGEVVQIGGFDVEFGGMRVEGESNRDVYAAQVNIFDSETGRAMGEIAPSRNVYFKTPDMPTSEVGLRMSPIQDVYVVLNGWDESGNSATFTIYINPLTMWMWIGGFVLALGTLIASWPHTIRRRNETYSAVAYATGD